MAEYDIIGRDLIPMIGIINHGKRCSEITYKNQDIVEEFDKKIWRRGALLSLYNAMIITYPIVKGLEAIFQ